MRGGSFVYRFGPFEFDPASGRLFRGASHVPLSDSQSAILSHLIVKAGQVVSKADLVEAGWGSVAVTENSLKQSISRLRKTLGTAPDGAACIETITNRGYRFTAAVERAERHDPDLSADDEIAPYLEFAQGTADLHSLNRERLDRARGAFERSLRLKPDYVRAHIGLANACALIFDATRVDARCDLEALRQALEHGRRATVRAPASGEAWIALAFAQYLRGDILAATASADKAIELEPYGGLHWLRVAYIRWGEGRICAAQSLLALCPGLALANWLIATVLIARGAFDAALKVLAAGCREQDAQTPETGFPAVGLHLLRGLVLAAQQRLDEAEAEFTSELSFVGGGQVYAHECAANTWYALGAIRLRQRRHREAECAFRQALDVAPAHFSSAAALGQPVQPLPAGDPRAPDAALARAIGLVRAGRHSDAAAVYREVVTPAPLFTGWILPVEPLINVAAHPEIWYGVLAMIRQRAV